MKRWYIVDQIADTIRNRKALILATIILTIITIIVFREYISHGLPLGSDSMGLVSEIGMKKTSSAFFLTWNPVSELGHLTYPSTVLEFILYVGMVILGLPSGILIMCLYAGSFWVSGMSMWYCSSKITRNPYGALAAALLYQFSQVSLSQYTEGHLTFVIGFAILPFVIAFCWMSVQKPSRRNAIALLVSCLILGSVSAPHFAFISVFLILSFGIPYLLLNRSVIRNIVPIALSVPLILVPTVFGRFFGNSYGLTSAFSVEDAFTYSSRSIMDAFALKATETSNALNGTNIFWGSSDLIQAIFILLAALLPILVFIPLLKKNGKYKFLVISLAISTLASIFLSKGPNPPFSDLFDWSFTNIPMLDSMRVFSRFLLINAFSYAILVAILIDDPPKIRFDLFKCKSSSFLKSINTRYLKAIPVIIIALIVVIPSSGIFSGAIGSFDLPTVYKKPLDWVANEDGDFRIITLPYGYAYYPTGLERLDGYPNSNTLDVGSYSPLFTGHELANSPFDPFWIYMGSAINSKDYGYKEAPKVLGYVGSVKFVVCQAYADPDQIKTYESLNGLHPIISLDGNAKILVNDFYKPRVNFGSNITVIVGGLGAILPAIQTGTLDLSKYSPTTINGAFGNSSLSEWLSSTPSIIVDNGDFLNLVVETNQWPSGSLIQLSPYGIRTTNDYTKGWVVNQDNILNGISEQSGIATSADATVTVNCVAKQDGWYEVLLKQEYAAENGNLTLTVNTNETSTVRTAAVNPIMKWTDFGEYWMKKGDNQIELRNVGDGKNNLEKLLVMDRSSLNDMSNATMNTIVSSKTQMTYLINGVDLVNKDEPEWRSALMENGTAAVRDSIILPWNEGLGHKVSDPLSIYNSSSVIQSGSNQAQLDGLGTLSANTGYYLRVNARTDVNVTGEVATVSLRSSGVEIANMSIGGDQVGSDAYSTVTLPFAAVNGMNGNLSIVCNVLNLSSGLKIDWMEISPINQRGIEDRIFLPSGQSTISLFADSLSNSAENVTIWIDGLPQKLIEKDSDGTYRFQVEASSTGYHKLTIDSHSLYMISVEINSQSVNTTTQRSTTFEIKSPTEYVVHTNSSQQSILAISESYHEYWTAYSDGVRLQHIELFSKINGFIVPEGNHTITIVFGGDGIYDISLGLTLFYCLASVAVFWRLGRRWNGSP